MKRQKNKFWNLIFSCLPGAGHMYQGFMKEGISLMSAFFLIIVVASWLQFAPIAFILPVIWFYSFFDSLNRNGLLVEEFDRLEDHFLWIEHPETFKIPQSKVFKNGLAIVLILIGLDILVQNIFDFTCYFLDMDIVYYIRDAFSYLPQLVVAIIIIAVGIRLITGKKKELDARVNDADRVKELIVREKEADRDKEQAIREFDTDREKELDDWEKEEDRVKEPDVREDRADGEN